jgi:phosphoribosyl-ATP pyrophosphohydrolase
MSVDTINELCRILEERKGTDPKKSYVAGLYAKGTDHILKKVGEEAAELLIAGKGGLRDEIVHETADLWFHSLVLLVHNNIDAESVISELARRFGQSGLEEKAARRQQ